MKTVAKIGGKVAMFAFLAFVGTFTLYMTNGENKLIYYVIRPLLNSTTTLRSATAESYDPISA